MPRDILTIASAVKTLYEAIFNVSGEESDLTEMKMHKLLYFAQKNHYSNFGEWLFNEDFEGWKHGPVNRTVRSSFHFLSTFDGELSPEEEFTIREVIYEYGTMPAWQLRNLSHDDSCYKKSRIGLSEDDVGNRIILKENIIKDITSNDPDYTTDCGVH
ncbi:Panacea domain-containing protein [Brevibacillus fluminis]|uniref:Panacea domain-containing protein n=1 Tax=Brevibacillus fluminis TaxID=511487 RepID=UPI003F890004